MPNQNQPVLQEADKNYDAIITTFNEGIDLLARQGNIKNPQNIQNALAKFEFIIEINPHVIYAHVYVGVCYFLLNDYKNACFYLNADCLNGLSYLAITKNSNLLSKKTDDLSEDEKNDRQLLKIHALAFEVYAEIRKKAKEVKAIEVNQCYNSFKSILTYFDTNKSKQTWSSGFKTRLANTKILMDNLQYGQNANMQQVAIENYNSAKTKFSDNKLSFLKSVDYIPLLEKITQFPSDIIACALEKFAPEWGQFYAKHAIEHPANTKGASVSSHINKPNAFTI
jgi:hypothetical protein